MAEEATKTKEEAEETEDEAEETNNEEQEDEETAESEHHQDTEEAQAPSVDLSDDAQEVVDQFQDLDDDQRREAFLSVISESPVLWIKDVVDAMEDRFGISTAAPAAAATPAAADAGGDEEEEEEKAVVDVVLEDFGEQKIQVIKAVRGETDLGLKEAKSLVDEAPNTVKEGLPKEEAEEMKEEIEDAGAEVSLK